MFPGTIQSMAANMVYTTVLYGIFRGEYSFLLSATNFQFIKENPLQKHHHIHSMEQVMGIKWVSVSHTKVIVC